LWKEVFEKDFQNAQQQTIETLWFASFSKGVLYLSSFQTIASLLSDT